MIVYLLQKGNSWQNMCCNFFDIITNLQLISKCINEFCYLLRNILSLNYNIIFCNNNKIYDINFAIEIIDFIFCN